MIESILLAISALILCQYRWTGAFAYEFCFIFGIVSFSIYFFSTVIRSGKNFRSLLLLLVPLSIVLLYSLRIPTCDYTTGFIWFFLLPVPSAFFGIASGLFGKKFGRSLVGQLFFGMVPSLSLAILILFDFYFRPSLFFLHPAIGYYPGPLYDEWIPILSKVLTFRAWTIGLSLFMIILSKHAFQKRSFAYGVLLLMPLAFRSSLGWNYSHQDVRTVLDQHLERNHVHLHYQNASFREIDARVYLKNIEYHVREISETFGLEKDELEDIHVYIYPDAKTKYELTGARHTAIGHPLQRVVHLLKEPAYLSLIPHELTHVVTAEFGPWPFKINFKEALLEGVATAMEGYRGILSIHEWSAAMMAANLLPDLQRLIGPGTFLAHAPFRAYLASGSFCLWLIEKHGAQKFKTFYQHGNFEQVFGAPIGTQIDEWKTFLSTIVLSTESIAYAQNALKAKPIFERRCVHDVADSLEKAWTCDADPVDCKVKHLKTAWQYSGKDGKYALLLVRELIVQDFFSEANTILHDILQNGDSTETDRTRALQYEADIDVLENQFASADRRYQDLLQKTLSPNVARTISLRRKLLADKKIDDLRSWIRRSQPTPYISAAIKSGSSTLDDILQLAYGSEAVGNYDEALGAYKKVGLLAATAGLKIQAEKNIRRIQFLQLRD